MDRAGLLVFVEQKSEELAKARDNSGYVGAAALQHIESAWRALQYAKQALEED